jgi:hypothetical protein
MWYVNKNTSKLISVVFSQDEYKAFMFHNAHSKITYYFDFDIGSFSPHPYPAKKCFGRGGGILSHHKYFNLFHYGIQLKE